MALNCQLVDRPTTVAYSRRMLDRPAPAKSAVHSPLTNAERRQLKAAAQRLDPLVRLGRDGMSEAFLQSLDESLALHGLVKIRFSGFKEEKKMLAPAIAARTGSALIMRVGNVAVFHRPKGAPHAASRADA